MDLERRIEYLEAKMKAMEVEMDELRRGRQGQNYPQYSPGNAAYGTKLQGSEALENHPNTSPHQAFKSSIPPKPPNDWEHLIARVWLPRVFIIVLLLGVLWGFIAAVSSGYITEPVRCLLGLVASAIMYGFGEKQIRAKREGLAQVLLGGSVAVLILSLFAAHQLYGLIPSWLAFILYILSIALGVFTAVRHSSRTLVIIMTVGGYLIPFLVQSTEPNAWIVVGYEVLFSLAMTAISLRYSYRAAYFVSIGVLHLPLMILYSVGDFESSRHIFIGAVFLQHAALLALSMVRLFRYRLDETLSLMIGFGLVALWIYGLYNGEGERSPEPMMFIIWACLYSLIALWRIMSNRVPHAYLAIATCGWFLWLAEMISGRALPLAIIVEASLGIALGIILKSRIQQMTSSVIYLYGTLNVLLLVIREVLSVETLSWILMLASMAVLSTVIRRHIAEPWQQHVPDIFMWVDAFLAIIFLTEVTQVLTKTLSYDLQHLILSAEWALYAIAVIVYGVLVRKSAVRLAGLLYLLVTLLKVIFFDLPGVSIAVRAVLFIGLGIAGIAISRLLYKRKSVDAEATSGKPTILE